MHQVVFPALTRLVHFFLREFLEYAQFLQPRRKTLPSDEATTILVKVLEGVLDKGTHLEDIFRRTIPCYFHRIHATR